MYTNLRGLKQSQYIDITKSDNIRNALPAWWIMWPCQCIVFIEILFQQRSILSGASEILFQHRTMSTFVWERVAFLPHCHSREATTQTMTFLTIVITIIIIILNDYSHRHHKIKIYNDNLIKRPPRLWLFSPLSSQSSS